MPELPEVETIRRYLHDHIIGKTISEVEVLNPKSFQGSTEDVRGQTIVDTGRNGKVIHFKLENGLFLNVHLKMSGQLIYPQEPIRTTRVILHFNDNTSLNFNDLRKFGWVKVTKEPDGTKAPDVTRKEFTLEYFKSVIKKSKKPLKPFLLDQDKLAGVGNIYANDALFVAKIYPYRIANSLSDSEIMALHKAIIDIIQEGLDYGGTSASEVYRRPDGVKGSYQDRFKVYDREGKPCIVCGTPIIREKKFGRSSFYCPHCQK
jgi:formamidopyrimidine-DNA glycosylase